MTSFYGSSLCYSTRSPQVLAYGCGLNELVASPSVIDGGSKRPQPIRRAAFS
jgi:hypothetical protein